MLDFGSEFTSLKDQVKHYRNLNDNADCTEAIYLVYDFLRWAETKECSHILLPSFDVVKK